MGFELEQQVKEVDDQQDDGSATTEFDDCSICNIKVTERGMKSSLSSRIPGQLERTYREREDHTGMSKLNTAKASRQADI